MTNNFLQSQLSDVLTVISRNAFKFGIPVTVIVCSDAGPGSPLAPLRDQRVAHITFQSAEMTDEVELSRYTDIRSDTESSFNMAILNILT